MSTIIVVKGTSNHVVSEHNADLAEKHWSVDRGGYARRNIGSFIYKGEKLHRVVAERKYHRKIAKGEYVDHINGDIFDDRDENIRIVTPTQSNQNKRKHKDNTSGYIGVVLHKELKFKKYNARIQVDGKEISLGYYATAEEAHRVRRAAELKYFGEYARQDDSD
jgi:hypothetical protein